MALLAAIGQPPASLLHMEALKVGHAVQWRPLDANGKQMLEAPGHGDQGGFVAQSVQSGFQDLRQRILK